MPSVRGCVEALASKVQAVGDPSLTRAVSLRPWSRFGQGGELVPVAGHLASAFQSAFTCSPRSREQEAKFQKMNRGRQDVSRTIGRLAVTGR